MPNKQFLIPTSNTPGAGTSLPNGTTATTQAAGDSSALIATDQFVQSSQASITTTGLGGITLPMDSFWLPSNGTTKPNPQITDDLIIAARFILREKLVINHMTIAVAVGSAGGNMYVAIYSADGNTKITSAGPFTLATTSTSITAAPSGAPVTLLPGNYILAWTTEGEVTPGTALVGGISLLLLTLLSNKNAVNFGTAAHSATAGGVFPATLGTLTALGGSASTGLIAVFVEP